MACGHIIKQSFNQFCCQRIHSGIITILQIQFRCLLQTRDFHIKKATFKTIIFKHMLPGSQAEGNKTQHKKTIQTVCSVVIFSVLLSLTSFGEALLSRGGEGGIGIDCMSLVWISKPVVLHPQEEGMSLSVFTIIVLVPFFVPVALRNPREKQSKNKPTTPQTRHANHLRHRQETPKAMQKKNICSQGNTLKGEVTTMLARPRFSSDLVNLHTNTIPINISPKHF